MNTAKDDDKVADALRNSWVYFLPRWVWPYAQLARWERPIGWQLLMWPGIWSIMLAAIAAGDNAPSIYQLVLGYLLPFWLGAFLMRGAGCTYNDLTDIDIDRQVERTRSRPLPSGRVSKKQAWAFLGLQSAGGLAVLLFLARDSAFVFWLGAASLVLVAIYPYMKRVTWWPQLFLGLAFSWGALLGWASVAHSLALAPILLYVGSISWVIGYDTIYAHQDREDDALVGVKSTARLFGENSKLALSILYSLALLLFASAYWLVFGHAEIEFLAAFAALAIGAAHLFRQIITLDIDDGARCLQLFKSNHHFGLILFAGLLVSFVFA